MATFTPTRLSPRMRSGSGAPRPLRTDADWSLRPFDGAPDGEQLHRSRSTRESTRNAGHGTGPIWDDLDEYERREAEHKEAYALQTRRAFAHQRAQSEDTRRPASRRNRSRSSLRPRENAHAELRSSSDPQTPRIQDLTDTFNQAGLQERPTSESTSEADEYEAPPTLLEQAKDCLRVLQKASERAAAASASDGALQLPATCEDLIFRLKVWMAESNIEKAPTTVDTELDGEVVALVSSVLYRLHARVALLARSIKQARKSSDAMFSFVEPIQKEVDDDVSNSESESRLPSTEYLSPAAEVHQHVKQVGLQIRTLCRLTRSLRVAQKDPISKVIVGHVAQITHLFGETEDCDKWKEEVKGMPGDAALRKVKEIAGVCG